MDPRSRKNVLFFFLIVDNFCPKESVLKIIEMITIHCCLTLNMNSHIMTCPPYNNSLISIIRLRDPCASSRGNAALMQNSWLLPALFISGTWGWDRGGELACSFLPPKLVLKIPRTSGHGGVDSRDNHRQGATLHDGAAGDSAGAAVLLSPGVLGPPGTDPPAPTLSQAWPSESLG